MNRSSEPRKDIDWASLGFQFSPVRSHIRYTWKNGEWSKGTLCNEHTITMSVAATCLHYGQAAFEGLKAFRCKDGRVCVFRPDENCKRMNRTVHQLLGPEIPEEMFLDAVRTVVRDNIDYVPPYGSGGSLYIRPLYIGTGSQIGVAPADQYDFLILVMPVGAYYKDGLHGVPALIIEEYDRAAPLGMGQFKVAGNYGASLMPAKKAKLRGFPIPLFLDPKEHKYIDEFGTSNFLAISRDGKKYITSDSASILPSVTNKSLMQVAEDIGLTVEKRAIEVGELADFAEVDACGTAVVITPISSITYGDTVFQYANECGKVSKQLYDRLTGIQKGEVEDTHNWLMEV